MLPRISTLVHHCCYSIPKYTKWECICIIFHRLIQVNAILLVACLDTTVACLDTTVACLNTTVACLDTTVACLDTTVACLDTTCSKLSTA